MTQEEKEYNEFMSDISNKAKEMYEKYNALSVSNKKKIYVIHRASGSCSWNAWVHK